MDDRFRTSDADRDRVAARLREHFAEGRLTRQELDDRLTTTLTATTFGDLRGVLADLPEPGLATRPARPLPPAARRHGRRGPRVLPLLLLALVAALVLPGTGWFLVAFLQAALLLGLLACLAGGFAAARFARRARDYHGQWQHGPWQHAQWQHAQWQQVAWQQVAWQHGHHNRHHGRRDYGRWEYGVGRS